MGDSNISEEAIYNPAEFRYMVVWFSWSISMVSGSL